MEDVFRDDLLDGDHAVITGGSSGINFGIAKRFAEKGANLTLIARTQEKLDRAADELRDDHGVEALGLSADVRDYDALAGVIEEAVDELGPIDTLVCGAAGNFPAPAVGMSANGFKAVVDIDLGGTFNACRAAFEHFEKPGASVIAISAPQSEQPTPMQSHVCAAKAGVDALVKTLAIEWGDAGVRVNAIQPGPVEDTEGMKRLTPDEESQERVKKALPAGRYARKEEIAELALYLTLPPADYITGSIIPCDGGQMLVGSGSLMDALMG